MVELSVVEMESSIVISSSLVVHVLVVDDDEGQLEVTEQILEAENGFNVEVASSVLVAMDKLSKGRFDVVVSDYDMPHKTGLEFLQELNDSSRKIPFILFTGKGREEVAAMALNLGAFRYVNKHGDPATVYTELASGIKQAADRSRFERTIQSSEECFAKVFDVSSAALAITRFSDGCFVDANNEFLNLLGYRREELIGKTWAELNMFLPEAERLEIAGCLKATGKVIDLEVSSKSRGGKPIHGVFSASMVNIKGQDHILTTVIDITARKQTEADLNESREKFRALFDENPEATIFVDDNFCFVDVNPQFSILFGFTLQEIRGKSIFDAIIPEGEKEKAKNLVNQVRDHSVRFNSIRMRKDGSLFPVRVSIGPVVLGGIKVGYVGVYQDISEMTEVHEELNRALANAKLLNDKLDVVSLFARHDVRNKLSVINGNLFLARKQMKNQESVQRYLDQIKAASDSVVHILDFAGSYKKLGSENLTLIDVGKVFDASVLLVSDLKGTKIVNEILGVLVLADSTLVTVFYNLLDNSLKYAQKLTQIKVHTRENKDGSFSILYEDDGLGIEAESKKSIFTQGFGKGSGYGLYLIKRTCEIYGWSVNETGEFGTGVRFDFNLPSKSTLSNIEELKK